MPWSINLPCSAPKNEAPFHSGTAISVWQNSGGGPSNWDTWVNRKTLFGGSPIMGGDKVGVLMTLVSIDQTAEDSSRR
jgi:hypothetical protein